MSMLIRKLNLMVFFIYLSALVLHFFIFVMFFFFFFSFSEKPGKRLILGARSQRSGGAACSAVVCFIKISSQARTELCYWFAL